MILYIYNGKRELVNTITNKVEFYLLKELYNKFIVKSKDIKQVQYKYNYNNMQQVTFIFSDNYRYIFKNISTSLGYLDLSQIQ